MQKNYKGKRLLRWVDWITKHVEAVEDYRSRQYSGLPSWSGAGFYKKMTLQEPPQLLGTSIYENLDPYEAELVRRIESL